MKNLFLAIFVICIGQLYAQAPLNVAVRLNVTNVSGSNPYTITGVVQDGLGLWDASSLSVSADSVYHLEGSDLLIYRITSITPMGNNFTMVVNDIMSTGILPSTGNEWAAIEFTPTYQYPIEVGNLSTTLKSAIDNRFKQRLDALVIGGSNIDYITTDSFTTFTNGATFASIPIGKKVWRTTTGSEFEKTSSTAMTKRSTDNGHNALLSFTQSGGTLLFNSRLYNRVKLNTGNISAATISNPNYYSLQDADEIFMIGVTSGSSDVVLTWGDVYGVFNNTTYDAMPTITVPAQSTMYFCFRVVYPSAESVKFRYVDGGAGGGGGAANALQLPLGFTETIGTVSADSTGEAIQAIAALLDVRASTIGTVVDFMVPKTFGTTASPVSGNITFNFANAAMDEQHMVHRSYTAPTFPVTAIVEGLYISGANNHITFRHIDSSTVLVAINTY